MQGTEINTSTNGKVAGKIGPAPLYDDKYPYSPHPYPAVSPQNLQ
ncbi:hypothetical protein [Rodentibacter pneumotropicus]|nr:hypothetical protein [Rodentibacter pneumotropicus]